MRCAQVLKCTTCSNTYEHVATMLVYSYTVYVLTCARLVSSAKLCTTSGHTWHTSSKHQLGPAKVKLHQSASNMIGHWLFTLSLGPLCHIFLCSLSSPPPPPPALPPTGPPCARFIAKESQSKLTVLFVWPLTKVTCVNSFSKLMHGVSQSAFVASLFNLAIQHMTDCAVQGSNTHASVRDADSMHKANAEHRLFRCCVVTR